MMDNLNQYKELEKLLRMESRYCTEDGVLLKNAIVEAALEMRPDLIKRLLTHDALKRNFFTEIDGILVFDKVKFQKFVMNKRFLPDSYTSFKNKIGLTDDNGNFISESREIVLSWPYKDCMLEGGQTKEDAKRNEVFWNEILAPDEINRIIEPKVLSDFIRYDCYGESHPTKISPKDNFIIKGNNLLVLESLKRRYKNSAKIIYIDVPYNTGNDSFGYNDSFKHSTWLTFMHNRINAAIPLLRSDGVFILQCDDNEQAYLKVLLDGFHQLKFLNCIAIKMSEATGVKMNHARGRFPKLKEYILIYTMHNFKQFEMVDKYKSETWDKENNIFLSGMTREKRNALLELELKDINTQEDSIKANDILKSVRQIPLSKKIQELGLNEEDLKEWLFENSYRIIKTAGSSSLAKLVDGLPKQEQEIASAVSKRGVLFFYLVNYNRDTAQPRLRVIFADENIEKNPCDFWQDIKTAGGIASEGGIKLENGKKPEKILYRLIKMCSKPGELVVDFFGGSGTTAAVAMKMGRRFISCEQLDNHIELMRTRIKNVINGDETGISKYPDVNWVGGGSFIYCELAQANHRFVDEINATKSDDELTTIWADMQQTGFLSWKIEPKQIEEHATDFEALSLENKKLFLIECLDKNLLYVPLSEINNAEFHISNEDKYLNTLFYEY